MLYQLNTNNQQLEEYVMVCPTQGPQATAKTSAQNSLYWKEGTLWHGPWKKQAINNPHCVILFLFRKCVYKQ